jgi:pyruvate dehydrogenase E1 component alpha subunit
MKLSTDDLVRMYEYMVFCRILEAELSEIVPYWHACEGEEASLVGSFYGLENDDYVSVHYRGVSLVYYMRGADLRRIIAGHIGKDTSYTRGRIASKTGPMQIRALGKFSGSLGTNWHMAVGVALSIKLKKQNQVVVVNFGDGSSSRGDFHEAINFAGVQKLPVVFICQNNQYGSSLPFSKATAAKSIADRAIGYGIAGYTVDGNDVIRVHEVVQSAVAETRCGRGPALIETQTYRVCGHNVADKENYRTKEEVEEWRKKDPIRMFEKNLLAGRILTPDRIAAIHEKSSKTITDASKLAQSDPWPGREVLEIGGVFAPS